MKAENLEKKGCLQRDSVEHKEYVGAHSIRTREPKEKVHAEEDMIERILCRENLNRAYKRVKGNKGVAGVDGMTVEEALPWLKENREGLLERVREGKYRPSPVLRKEIPKSDGGKRKLGIPTVIDRIIQQAITQQITPIYEPKFSEGSYGYRPNRSAQEAAEKVREYADRGYRYAVVLDLSKYFDTLNHELLMNMLRQEIKDKRVIDLIKKYLKSGVMENGVVMKTKEGSPQGGPLSPILANIYLTPFDREFERRGVPVIRYADDIAILGKSQRAAERLLRTSREYLEKKLKLKVNEEKSRVVSVHAIRNFKFLGFAFGKNKKGTYIRPHAKSKKKAKDKLRKLTARNQGRSARDVMNNVKIYIRGWLNYYKIADMKSLMGEWNGWLRRRMRMYIWKQWKNPKTKVTNLERLGMEPWKAYRNGNTRKGYWAVAGSGILTSTITNKRLAQAGYFDILAYYESLHERN